jgi:ribosomal protein S18 acetylase RimI-like enzyme
MTQVKIRKITTKDLDELQKISRQTFNETFAAVNSAENMEKYLEIELSAAKLLSELANPDSAFYFAEYDNQVIGYLKLNFGKAQTELKDGKALEIERIYVLAAYQGKQIGQLLYQQAIQAAKKINAEYVWLGVWEENTKAINFYVKNGFVEFDKHIFYLGDDAQTDIMMKLELPEKICIR